MFRKTSDLPFTNDTSSWFLPWLLMLMVFLATLSVAGSLSLNTMLGRWSGSISGSLTVQVLPYENNGKINLKKTNQEVQEVLLLLKKTAGIASADLLNDRQLKDLLKPWLGESVLLEDLPMPRLIDVKLIKDAVVDYDALRKELQKIAPNTTVDVHKLWMGKLISLAGTFRFLASAILTLVLSTTSIIVIYVTSSTLSVHKPVIELLHLIGAHDTYIAQQYAKRITFLSAFGSIVGFLLAMPVLFIVASKVKAMEGGLLSEAHFDIISWIILIFIPIFAILLSTLTAYWTVQKTLRRLL